MVQTHTRTRSHCYISLSTWVIFLFWFSLYLSLWIRCSLELKCHLAEYHIAASQQIIFLCTAVSVFIYLGVGAGAGLTLENSHVNRDSSSHKGCLQHLYLFIFKELLLAWSQICAWTILTPTLELPRARLSFCSPLWSQVVSELWCCCLLSEATSQQRVPEHHLT